MESPAGRAHLAEARALAEEWRKAAHKCGAKRRTEGGAPCRNVALENGRCRLHGGRVPKGADWHKPQLPGPGASLDKLERKVADLEKRRQKQAARVAAMTPEQRENYEAHKASMLPGPASGRARRKAALAARERIAEALAAAPVESARVAELKQREAELVAGCGQAQEPTTCPPQRAEPVEDDMAHDDTPERALERNLARIRTEGLDAAVSAAIDLLRDAKAPAAARSAAVNAVFRGAGVFGAQAPDDDRDPADLSPAELAARIQELRAREKDLEASIRSEGDDIFG